MVGYKALQTELGKDVVGIAISQVLCLIRGWHNASQFVSSWQCLKSFSQPAALPIRHLKAIWRRVMVEALNQAGPAGQPRKIIASLNSMRPFDMGGFLVDFGKKNHRGSNFVEVTIVGNHGRLMR